MVELFGKALIFLGLILVVIGLILSFTERVPYIGKLPGDILITKGNFTFYFPLGTSILISIVLTVIFYLLSRFFK
jgi:predicted phosphohydrolase